MKIVIFALFQINYVLQNYEDCFLTIRKWNKVRVLVKG